MTLLCGWLAGHTTSAPADILARMTGAVLEKPPGPPISRLDASAGIAVSGPSPTGDVAAEGAVWAAIAGNPRWTDAEIAAIAGRNGPAAALAAAYARFGRDLVDRVLGPWALAVVDGGRRAALLATDRFGVQPLCYAATGPGGLVFATAATAVAAHPGIGTAIAPQALYDYLYFTRIPAPETVFRDVRKLLPGERLWFADGTVELDTYWRVPFRDDEAADIDALSAEMMDVLRGAMGRLTNGVDLGRAGAYLSGGLDSSTVAGLLAERSSGQAQVFSIGFDAEGYDEMDYARRSAAHFGCKLHEYYVTPADVADFVPRIARLYDEPFGNASAVPAYHCARLAREAGIDVMFAGDGGDEIFAGNERYVSQRVFEAYGALPEWLRRRVLEPALFALPAGDRLPLVRKALSYVRRANVPLPDRIQAYNFYNDVGVYECFVADVARDIDVAHPMTVMRGHYHDPPSASTLKRMLNLDIRTTLADDDLRKVGRTAELAGVDVRYPMLDEDVVAFAARVPSSLLVAGSRLRHFFKQAMSGYLPAATISKKKHGFGLPFGHWLKTDPALQALAYDSLQSLKRRDLVQPSFLDRAIDEHRAGHAAFFGEVIWVLMVMELWFQAHLDGAATRD